MTKLAGQFGTMPQEPWHPRKGAEPDSVIQLNCREVRTHVSYKTRNNLGLYKRSEIYHIYNFQKH